MALNYVVQLFETEESNKVQYNGVLFSSKIFREKTVDFPSHRIFGHMHGALNIDKKIKLITQFRRNGR
jgi:hypothetical protein